MATTNSDTRTLEEIAKEYYSVRRSELTLTDEETDNIIQNAKGRFTKLVAAALETTAHLMEHAESDAVRWNVTKYVLDNELFKVDTADDEIEKLLRELTKNHNAQTTA